MLTMLLYLRANFSESIFYCIQSAIDKLEQYKGTAEEDKITYDRQVRELTFKLEVRMEDLSRKEVSNE